MLSGKYAETFGKNLRSFREESGLTRQSFAMKYELNVSTLMAYEIGRNSANFSRFLTICNVTGLSPDRLLSGLVSWHTEQDDIREMEELIDAQCAQAQRRIRGALDIVIDSMISTPPKLMGAGFGERLSILRMDASLEVLDLAEQSSIARSTYQGYESGQFDPSMPALLSLCEIFMVSPEYMLAPNLERLTYRDQRMAWLRPKHIRALLELSRYLAKVIM